MAINPLSVTRMAINPPSVTRMAINPPICNQNGPVWAGGRKADAEQHRLLVEWEKFAPRVTNSAWVCIGIKWHLYILDKKAKVIAAYYVEKLLPKLVEDCEQLLPNGFIFQQDGAPAYTDVS